MNRFCKKCGKELGPDGVCTSCPQDNLSSKIMNTLGTVVSKVFARMGIAGNTEEEKISFLERKKMIVPDVLSTNQDEIPVKQYKMAILRSRILGKYAEGRLQITNKRVIFRAPGISYAGKIILHHEFSINEIGGVEVRRGTRVSFLNIILGLILSGTVITPFETAFSALNQYSSILATIIGIILMAALVVPFFIFKKKFWLKLILTSAAFGVSDGITNLSDKAIDYFVGKSFYEITDLIASIVFFIWLFNMILVCLVPDLKLVVKSNGASDAIEIRRKKWGILMKETKEYTGFSEVVPWKEADLATQEIGAIISDIQTMGDMAIEKWKVN